MLNSNSLAATLEAILFAVGEPLEIERITQAIEADRLTVESALKQLQSKYEADDCGLCLLRLDDKYQLCTKQKFADSIRAVIEVKKNAPLSQAAFEVLAIIAYNQPVTRAFMEQIRGVDCSGVVATLCEKELIEEAGRLDLPGRPIAFKTTANFLRAFGLSGLDMLPALPAEAKPHELLESLSEASEKSQEAEETDQE